MRRIATATARILIPAECSAIYIDRMFKILEAAECEIADYVCKTQKEGARSIMEKTQELANDALANAIAIVERQYTATDTFLYDHQKRVSNYAQQENGEPVYAGEKFVLDEEGKLVKRMEHHMNNDMHHLDTAHKYISREMPQLISAIMDVPSDAENSGEDDQDSVERANDREMRAALKKRKKAQRRERRQQRKADNHMAMAGLETMRLGYIACAHHFATDKGATAGVRYLRRSQLRASRTPHLRRRRSLVSPNDDDDDFSDDSLSDSLSDADADDAANADAKGPPASALGMTLARGAADGAFPRPSGLGRRRSLSSGSLIGPAGSRTSKKNARRVSTRIDAHIGVPITIADGEGNEEGSTVSYETRRSANDMNDKKKKLKAVGSFHGNLDPKRKSSTVSDGRKSSKIFRARSGTIPDLSHVLSKVNNQLNEKEFEKGEGRRPSKHKARIVRRTSSVQTNKWRSQSDRKVGIRAGGGLRRTQSAKPRASHARAADGSGGSGGFSVEALAWQQAPSRPAATGVTEHDKHSAKKKRKHHYRKEKKKKGNKGTGGKGTGKGKKKKGKGKGKGKKKKKKRGKKKGAEKEKRDTARIEGGAPRVNHWHRAFTPVEIFAEHCFRLSAFQTLHS